MTQPLPVFVFSFLGVNDDGCSEAVDNNDYIDQERRQRRWLMMMKTIIMIIVLATLKNINLILPIGSVNTKTNIE